VARNQVPEQEVDHPVGMFRAFRSGPFRLLWSSAVLIQLGYWFSTIAFQTEVARRTGNDAWQLGILYFCTFAPFLLLSLPAGALADSVDRRRLLWCAQGFAVLTALTCLALTVSDALSLPGLMTLAFLSGCVVAVVSPAGQALIANSVPVEDLSTAIPLQSAGLNLARIFGPALAAPALLLGGSTGAFGMYTAMCLAALLIAARLPTLPQAAYRRGESLRRRVLAGVVHARGRPPALLALATTAATSVFAGAYQSQLPVIGSRVSGGDDSAFLVLITLGGAGSLIGVSLVALRRSLPTVFSSATQLVALGVTVSIFGLTDSYGAVSVLMVIAGTLTFSIMTSVNTTLQHLIDDSQRGRVMSLYFLCWGGLLPFGGLGMGALIRGTGSTFGLVTFGLAAGVLGLVIAGRAHRVEPHQD